MVATLIHQTSTRINQGYKRQADWRQCSSSPFWISLFSSPSTQDINFFTFLSVPHSFPNHFWLTFIDVHLHAHICSSVCCIHTQSDGFKIQVLSPSLFNTHSVPINFCTLPVLNLLPSDWDHPDPPVFPSAPDWDPAWQGVQQTTAILLVSAEIINTPSMPQRHE